MDIKAAAACFATPQAIPLAATWSGGSSSDADLEPAAVEERNLLAKQAAAVLAQEAAEVARMCCCQQHEVLCESVGEGAGRLQPAVAVVGPRHMAPHQAHYYTVGQCSAFYGAVLKAHQQQQPLHQQPLQQQQPGADSAALPQRPPAAAAAAATLPGMQLLPREDSPSSDGASMRSSTSGLDAQLSGH